jgi:hypothetical protein
MPNLAAAVNHANNYWYRSCADNQVWTPNVPVNINRECRGRNLDPAQWVGRFLVYERSEGLAEGLFLVPAAVASPATMKARGYRSRNFPDKVFLCSWSDNKKDVSEGQTPPFTGLNDCSHFVSECLKMGGIGVWALNAPDLVKRLRGRTDTRTLCLQVDKERARWIINAGLLTPGDVIAFSDWTGFRHATLYLGGRMIAMHTSANHPDGDPMYQRSDGVGANNWEGSAHASHPNVTLIHFTHNDRDTRPLTWAHGWWKIIGPGKLFFYYLSPEGMAFWVNKAPTKVTGAPEQPGGRGFWFTNAEGNIHITWRDTGTLEFFRRGPNNTMTGASTGEVLAANRLDA